MSMASVYTRGTKYWISVSWHGRRERAATPWRTGRVGDRAVERFRRDVEDRVHDGTFSWTWFNEALQGGKRDMRVRLYADLWFDRRRPSIKKSTADGYATIVNRINAHLGDQYMRDVRPSDVADFRAAMLNRGLSAKTVRDTIGMLADMFSEYCEDRPDTHSPVTASVVRGIPNRPQPKADVFTHDEVVRILDYCKHNRPAWLALYATAFYAGMRPGEIAGLRWEDVDFEERKIHVRRSMTHGKVNDTTKTGKDRTIDMIDPLVPYLEAHKQHTYIDGAWVFLNTANEPIMWPGQTIAKHWRPMLRNLHIRYRSVKQTRHTFACLMLDAGELEAWVVKMLGHSSREMVRKIYGNRIVDDDYRGGGRFVEQIREAK